MAAVTIKDIPDALYEKLKLSAKLNYRTINNEIIVCIQKALMPEKISAEESIERARKIRPKLKPDMPGHDEIMNAIEEGRPLQSPPFAKGDLGGFSKRHYKNSNKS